MKRIPLHNIEVYWKQVNTQSNEGEIFNTLKKLYDEQSLIMSYLTVADKESLDENERQMLYYLGSFVVHVMLSESASLAEVSIEEWERVRSSNLKMLQFLASEDKAENFVRSMNDVIEASNQSELFRFVADRLMHDPHCQSSVREENVWRVFAHLKIVIDALDKAVLKNLDNRVIL